MATRAKFVVQSKTETRDGFRVALQVVTGTNEENASFFKWTPTGQIDMGLVEAETAKQFVPGKEFYVDFTEAE